MNADDWQAVRALFEALCDLPATERQRRIEEAGLDPQRRALLQSMLAADGGAALRDDAAAQAPEVVAALAPDERPGSLAGPWRIETLIGAGGMGRVYRARREDGRYEGLAAIKFVAEAANPGFFLHERHVLARLAHPGIARLLDAGEDARGQPYLVMEYVDGIPIDAHCEAIGADARTRFALVIAAARAIAHAHAQWVLHRDLKPANLLVDRQGQVKVLDFGVAKLLDRTGDDPQLTSARYFTLRHAAPEQIAGEPTGTGVDLFALAVILFELLAGTHPFAVLAGEGRSFAERVLAGDATPLRRALRDTDMLRGLRARDLEAVLAKALARDPAARYASVQEFADELGRILDDRAVLARPPSTAEQVARLARRHRAGFALGALALLALVGVSGVALWQADAAERERDAAQREAARAERIADFLTGLFEAAQPLRNQGRVPSARDLLDRGREQLAHDATLDPAVRGALLASVADSYRALGHYAEAETLLREAVDQAVAGDPRLPAWQLQLGRVHNFQSRWTDAERELRRGLQMAGGDPMLQAGLQRQLAVSLLNQERATDAESAARAALAQLRAFPGAPTRDLVDTEMLLATMAYSRNDLPAALSAYEGIVAAQRAGSAADQQSLVTSLNNLAAIEMRLDRLDVAVAHYREAIALARSQFGARNREVALPLLGLGSALRASGQVDAAREALAESHAIYFEWSGPAHAETAYAALLLGELEWLRGDAAAARVLSDAIGETLAADHPTSVKACRADLLALALMDDASEASSRQRAAVACLSADAVQPNLRLLARWVGLRRGLAEPAKAGELAAAARALVPRDDTLRQALERSALD